MCAITGALLYNINSHERATKAEQTLLYIMAKSRARGRDGYGWHALYNRRGIVYEEGHRDVLRAPSKVFPPVIVEVLRDQKVGSFGLTTIGNFRAEPTTEFVRQKRKSDQQPYTVDAWSIVHNGTVANDKALRTNKVDTSIDSAAIVEMLAVQGRQLVMGEDAPYAMFNKAVKGVTGSYAILATNNQVPNQIFAATNYRPIWYAENELGAFFASCEDYFPPSMYPCMIPPYSSAKFWHEKGRVQKQIDTLREPARSTPRALVIASGGLDSTVAAAFCVDAGYEVELLHFEYGCRAEAHEVQAIEHIAEALGVKWHLFPLNIYSPSDSRLLDRESNIAGGEEGAEFAHEWVPARNLVMLSVATAYAEANDFDYIVLGNNMEEAGAYPDNEPEFVKQFNKVLPFAVGNGKQVQVLMPVGDLMKHEIIRMGRSLNAPLHLTWSCYKNADKHCGKCGPCFMRRTAFEINQLDEVIEYGE